MSTEAVKTNAPVDPPASSRGPIERVTVNLNGRASDALERVVQLTSETKTDAINRALQVYAMLHEVQDRGGVIYTREREATELERLRIL